MTRAVTNERALWDEDGMSWDTCRDELGIFWGYYLLFFDSSAEFAALILNQPGCRWLSRRQDRQPLVDAF